MESKLKNRIGTNKHNKAENPEASERELPHSRITEKSREQMQEA